MSTIPTPSADIGSRAPISTSFYILLFGQFVSAMGSLLTGFALGVWLFQRTGSVLDFSSLTLCATLPALLLVPWTGSLTNRWNRRAILLVSECLAVLCTLTMALLIHTGRFQLWHLMLLQVLLSVSMAFQGPAYYATVTALVSKEAFTRVGGMAQFVSAFAQLSAPLLAASALAHLGIVGVLTIGVVSFVASLAGLLAAQFPPLAGHLRDPSSRAFRDMALAIDFLRQRPSLMALYASTTLLSFVTSVVAFLISPLVLTHHSEKELAWVMTSSAIGVLASSLVLIVWGGPKQFRSRIFGLAAIQGLAIMVVGLFDSPLVYCVSAFAGNFVNAALMGYLSGIWRRKVEPARQGSFVALQQAVGLAMIPLAATLGGHLSGRIFEPALMPNGAWSDGAGRLFGTGTGAGMHFMFFLAGLGISTLALWSWRMRSMRRLEVDVPDSI